MRGLLRDDKGFCLQWNRLWLIMELVEKKLKSPVLTVIVISFIILLQLTGILYMYSNDKKEYLQEVENQTEHLSYALEIIESNFIALYQLIETTTTLSHGLSLNISSHERFLIQIFSSARSSLIYGIGIWYEPYAFNTDMQWYGPYIHYKDPRGGPFSVSYEWSTSEYNYQDTNWYRKILNSASDGFYITAPYFDTDYTYITVGKPFYRDGRKAGVITIDVILPLLEEFFSQFDFSEYEGLFLTLADNSILYTVSRIDKGSGSVNMFQRDNTQVFNREKIFEMFTREGITPLLLKTETKDRKFKLYGVMDRKGIIRGLIKNYSRNYIIFLFFCLMLPFFYYLSLRTKQKEIENRQLNFENTSLKIEIEKRKEAETALEFIAYHDPVTGLHNLNAFFETIDSPYGMEDSRYLIQVSLENMRELSIIMDRNIIDSILKDFAGRLISNCPDKARLFRGRGFNFYIVCRDTPQGNAFRLSRKLLQEFRKAILLHNRNIRLRVRFGLAAFAEAENLNQVVNMSQATISNSNSKQIDQIFLYSGRIQENNALMINLDAAMSQNSFIDELHLLYQPIIRVKDRETVGVEALIRWYSSYTGTIVSPADFIPLAEENGYIIELGWFVLQETIRVLASGLIPPDWFISVNVSPLQFIESGFPDKLDSMIKTAGIDKKRIKLEITESSASSTAQYFWQSVEELINREYRLAIDDFGTGESSLHRLYTLAFDTLKVDRTFVKDIQAAPRNIEIFRALLNLGKSMDNMVIVEGIETEKEHELLKNLGMTYAQGYLYSRPAELTDIIKEKPPR